MTNLDEKILDHTEPAIQPRRRKLLPIWIKIFLWIFLVLGAMAPVVLIVGAMGQEASLSLYGLSTTQPLSTIGLIITLLFVIKGSAAFFLWTEQHWAVQLAIGDAILGIALCTVFMFMEPVHETRTLTFTTVGFTFRFELVLLIPYLIKLFKIKSAWEQE